jgi:hypothetical protein
MLLRVALCAMLGATFPLTHAIAEVTITTDKTSYEVGEMVHIEAHNHGPDAEWIVSTPWFTIWNADEETCVYGCLGLPDVTEFPAGETVSMDWDTGLYPPDQPGNHAVRINVLDGPAASFVLTGGVANEEQGWTALKAQYR